MRIRFGFRLALDCAQPTPAQFLVDIHPSRRRDVLQEGALGLQPPAPVRTHTDGFGNVVRRLTLPAGRTVIERDGIIRDSGLPDPVEPAARQTPVADLPPDAMPFLLPSRYVESDLVGGEAWRLFGHVPEGWARVQAICDYVHQRIAFGYHHADNTRTAWRSLSEGRGVCRDFAHLAIALCRAMNIPARYCTGYLGDIGVPRDPAPMDFSAWFEAYLDGRWYSFDARHNVPRIGRVVIARGRDAADVAIVSTFGPHMLTHFEVWTDELAEEAPTALAAE
ncbi:transglutaminase-like domain-containing protein [Ancylobacter lacus]|uniref:transglutaminase-like domain-containing protein n=1 Tax=Ancylobacter lacus TaxID=2579970 RepID=UPI001BD0BB97|nr:transglutaminase family protein [Ancylobacter lacus]MBS7537402.1 transglutaminase family protein [Ancylobacter lacus]